MPTGYMGIQVYQSEPANVQDLIEKSKETDVETKKSDEKTEEASGETQTTETGKTVEPYDIDIDNILKRSGNKGNIYDVNNTSRRRYRGSTFSQCQTVLFFTLVALAAVLILPKVRNLDKILNIGGLYELVPIVILICAIVFSIIYWKRF